MTEPRLTRRELLVRGAAGTAATLIPGALSGCAPRAETEPVWINDVHSRLNRTLVAKIERPRTFERLREVIVGAGEARLAVSIGGARHAMGGQQFGRETIHLDTTGLDRVLDFDGTAGEVEVESGIRWPQLAGWLAQDARPGASEWRIAQRQMGADRICVGGAVAANAHGRALRKKPIVEDVVAFTLMNASGELIRCSRTENPELFRLAIGGYGLFGPMTSVRLKLSPRRPLETASARVVAKDFARHLDERIAAGFASGDLTLAMDLGDPAGLRQAISTCERPSAADPDRVPGSPSPEPSRSAGAGEERPVTGWSEMITEVCVPRPDLPTFLDGVREDSLEHDVELLRGVVRLVEKDDETGLPWVKDRFACVTLGVRVDHGRRGLKKAPDDLRRLLDRGLALGGGFHLAYHRWASRRQVLAAFPELPEFLAQKRRHDPEERFQSEWYRHYRTMFADLL